MTDEQIIAMLERNADYDCLECDYCKTVWCEGEGCNVKIAKLALDLIKRQQAEIDRLTAEKDNLIKTYAECQIAFLKEFAEKLEHKLANNADISHAGWYSVVADMQELVNEMIGGADNGNL